MNLFKSLSQYGMYILGLNLMLCGVSEGFLGMEGMEEMLPLLWFGGLGQSNYVRPPPPVRPIPPIRPNPPTQPPLPGIRPETITWRWVPNMRYMLPVYNPNNWNQQQQQQQQQLFPWLRNGVQNSVAMNTIREPKPMQGVIPGAPLNLNMMVDPSQMNALGAAGSGKSASSQMSWNTQTTSKGTTV